MADLLIKNGRVLDPANGINKKCDEFIEVGV
jgi:predicted amidohydrolase